MRLQAAADGAALVVVIERVATALHIVPQALVRGLQLLVALLQSSPFLPLLVLESPLVLLLHVAAAPTHLR